MIKNLKIIRSIQSNERFDAFEAKYGGHKVFAKRAKSQKTRELLAGVPNNSEVVNKLGKKEINFSFRAPEIFEKTDEWIVTEWIEGQPLSAQMESKPQIVADALANFFVVFDKEPVSDEGFRQIFTRKGLAVRMEERIPSNLNLGQDKVLKDAKNLFDELCPSLVPALQDADVKPDHIFPDPKKNSAYVLVDSEHLSPQWPRFYDLGNVFAKYWIRGNKNFSNQLLKTFLQKAGIGGKEIFKPLQAILVVRGISLHWELDYDTDAQRYNIPRAQALLKKCLTTRNLEDLTGSRHSR